LAVEVTCECAFDAAAGLAGGLAFREQPLVVGGGLDVVADACEGDHVQGPVQLAVAAAVVSLCRRCFPLEASTGLVPARAAKDASLAIRFGSPLETSSCAAQIGPTPGSLSRSGASSATSAVRARSSSVDLFGEMLDATAEPAQDGAGDLRA
jgi:hypothetical protein